MTGNPNSTSTTPLKKFCDKTKEKTIHMGIGGVGLTELLMEPVQRVPRYLLLLEGMVKNLGKEKVKLRETLGRCIEDCRKIASCEDDGKVGKHEKVWKIGRAVEGIPVGAFFFFSPGLPLRNSLFEST
jgi:protein ECT2